MNIAFLILAAGESSRMGAIKQLLPLNNTTLLENSLKVAKSSKAVQVCCVLGANLEMIKNQLTIENIEFIINSNYENGLGSSIACGVKFIEKEIQNIDKILIMLGDQPEVDSKILNSIIDLSLKNPHKIVATSYQENLGVPAIFPKTYFLELKKLNKDFGAKKIIRKFSSDVISFNTSKSLVDIDTPEDYQNYLKSLS